MRPLSVRRVTQLRDAQTALINRYEKLVRAEQVAAQAAWGRARKDTTRTVRAPHRPLRSIDRTAPASQA